MGFSLLTDSPRFLKPALDSRSYRMIRLSNNLRALLIHDPETDKSAAAMDVNVGSFADPKDLPGLAHFCEHLLFLGTQKYPKENEYGSYLSQNSGHSNAYTSSMHTNYYFEVKNEAMRGALDRFSQFFISPLFSPAGKDREINAVDSENKKNLQSDNWRLYQLSRSTTNIKHPYNGFSTGNKATLGDVPLELGLNVRDELIKFYTENYSSNLMTLCILSNESLETLSTWTDELFSEIKDKSLKTPYYQESPFDSDNYKGKLYKIKPIRDSRTLNITFPIPSVSQYWKSLPDRYISHLVGHESKGSLLFNFKSKGWANGLSCDAGLISPGYSEFTIEIELTESGLEHYNEILVDVFKYIEMLKSEGPKEWIFKELATTTANNFKFKQKSEPAGTVSKLANVISGLSYHEIEFKDPSKPNPDIIDVPCGDIPYERVLALNIIDDFAPEIITKLLSYLSFDNFRAYLISKDIFKDIPSSEIMKEEWYGTEYTRESYPIDRLLNLKADEAYHLPEKNEFIPTDFNLTEFPSSDYPKLVKMDQYSKIWYKSNTSLGGPRSAITIKFNLPGSTSTPLNSLYLSIFVELLEDELNSVAYLASLGGLQYHFNLAREGISLEIIGYSHKLKVLLTKLIETLNDFTTHDNYEKIWDCRRQQRYNILLDKLSRNLKNFGYSTPYQQVGPIVSSLVNENAWLVDDEISCLPAMDYPSLINYCQNLFKICFVEVLVLGNYSKDEAQDVHTILKTNLHNLESSITLTQSQFTRGRSLIVSKNSNWNYIKFNDDPENINSCIEMFIQLGDLSDSKARVLNELSAQIIHEPCFTRLRTQEQLGYVVFSGTRETRTTFGLRFLIQSEYPSFYLIHRVNEFLLKIGDYCQNMSEEEFQKHTSALINKKEQKFKNLKEERNKHWNRIASGYYDFDRLSKDIDLLKDISLAEIAQFMQAKVIQRDGEITVHLQSQKLKQLDRIKMIKNSVSNFVYSRKEFEDLNYEHEKVEEAIDSLDKESTVDQILQHQIFAEFPFKPELKEYIEFCLSTDWTKPTSDKDELISNVGEWKCQQLLTAAPTARIPEGYLDL